MSRPRLLDLFCGAGGAAMGYHRAGFEVVGVDIAPQPNYPFRLVQADALRTLETLLHCHMRDYSLRDFDAIHASPPCQAFTAYQRTGNVGEYPDLVEQTRELLQATALPYVIENVEGAPLIDPVVICGTMFDPPMEIQRHRLFETNWPLEPPQWPCRHKLNGKDRYPGGRSKQRTGSSRGLVRATMEIGSWDIPLRDQQEAMGIAWMTLEELSEAIPPAYTEFIGRQLMAHLRGAEPPVPDPRLTKRLTTDGTQVAQGNLESADQSAALVAEATDRTPSMLVLRAPLPVPEVARTPQRDGLQRVVLPGVPSVSAERSRRMMPYPEGAVEQALMALTLAYSLLRDTGQPLIEQELLDAIQRLERFRELTEKEYADG